MAHSKRRRALERERDEPRTDALIGAAARHSLFLPTDVAREMAAWALPRSTKRTIACGFEHSVALKSDGSLVSWGDDSNGQVSGTPTGTEFSAVATGGWHSVAFKSDGSLVSWGEDGCGQVSGTPTGAEFGAVATGHNHSVALTSDGSLVSWGSRADNYKRQSNTPTGNVHI